MKPAKILVLPLLALLTGCVATPEHPQSAARPAAPQSVAERGQPREVYVPVTGSGGATGFQQFRR